MNEYVTPHIASKPNCVPVLIAPSTGETCLILQDDIIQLLYELQQSGKYHFVWKLHPAAFNLKDFDESYEPHRKELSNLKFILLNFVVTSEEQPCLLPFLEAFKIIICDLHSTVPFTAS